MGINTTAPTSTLDITNDGTGDQTLATLNRTGTITTGDEWRLDFAQTGSVQARIAAERQGTDTDIVFYPGTSATVGTTPVLQLKGNDGQVVIGVKALINDLTTAGNIIINAASNVIIASGSGTPESVVTAGIGSTYHRTDGGAGTSFYVKESGTGNTGWIAK